MQKLRILSGLPASGKSTYAKSFCEKNPNWVRVNRDDLRHMRGEYWHPKDEKLITEWEDFIINSSIDAGKSVIIDSTNLNPKYESRWNVYGEMDGITIEIKHFDLSVEECIKRDMKRANSVGEKVIREMHDKYLANPLDIYYGDVTNPSAVIFDIDGTLAKMTSRGPYDWGRVGEDVVVQEVANNLDMHREIGDKIIIFTGRDGVCEKETKLWLELNDIKYDHFDIRSEGDTRCDTIIKREMFDRIKDKYYIESVYDDRDRVVKFWRSIGLQCFQCDYGDF